VCFQIVIIRKKEKGLKMNTKIVVMLLLATLALSSIAMIRISPVNAPGGTLKLSDAELMLAEFTWEFDPGSSLTGKTDVAGSGVIFDLAGLGKTGIGDNFPVNALAGGTGTGNGDFTAYNKYSMLFINVGITAVDVSLFMNTGWTNVDPRRDTFWCSNWVHLDAGKSAIVTLDFSASGQAWNIADDPEFTGHTNGESGTPIWRLNEVSNIGFQVLGSGSASVLVSETLTKLYIEPPVTNKGPGDVDSFFDIFVTIENFANLAGFDIKLTWDGNLITETGVDYGNYLDALWGAGNWHVVFEDLGIGYYELAAAALGTSASNTGASVLFKVTFHVDRSCNFPLSTSVHFDVVKLSDNTQPVPNPIYAEVTDGMYYMSATRPDLEFKVKKWIKTPSGHWEYVNPPYNFEYCDRFEVEIWVTHIHDCSPLLDYDLKITYDTHLAKFLDIDAWGTFGTGTGGEGPSGTITVHCDGGPMSGDSFFLVALTFHVEFSCVPEHIWKYGNLNYETFSIAFVDAELSFARGNIPMSGIDMPSPLTIQVNFIRGDVNCDGKVTIDDISTAAYYYGKKAPLEYDLTNDGTIDIYDMVAIATNYGYGV
jgi:hypothetical protein